LNKSRDEETGKFEESFHDEDIVELLRGKRLTTNEIAETVGCHRTTAYKRLTELESAGEVTFTRAGNAFIWERSE